ncbi:hypothetical protein ACFLZ1_02860 [Patescibacteria group bacterium]
MPTLTEVSFHGRRIIKFGAVIIVFIVFGKIALDLSINLYNQLNPPPPPPPTVAFGKLPAINFPEQEEMAEELSFKLETPTGTFPQAPDRAKVYFIPFARPNLLALDRAKQDAASLGFKNEPEALSERRYKWVNTGDANTVLEMDIISGAFKLNYEWQSDPNILIERNLPGNEQAKLETENFLKRIGYSDNDLIEGRMEVSYLKASIKDFIPAPSLSEANFVRVQIFRKDYDELPVLTANSEKGIVTIIYSGSGNYVKRIVFVDFNFFPIKEDSFATYPIKTPSAAWEELKAGKAYIANWNEKDKIVTIRRIYFAFYDSLEPQSFLQPIIVFEGDNDFFAYVSAVTSEWIK